MSNPVNVALDRRAWQLPVEDHDHGCSTHAAAAACPLEAVAPRPPFGIYHVSTAPQGEQR
jgi:hypothetical protein